MTETTTTSATYDQISAEYADHWGTHGDPLVGARSRFAALLTAGALVLDVGCGPGQDTSRLRQLGLRACGLDRSRGMLAQAQLRGAPLLLGDMRRLPVRDCAFDGLWVCASFLHIPKRDALLVAREFRRALRPGGVLYLAVKGGDGERWVDHPSGLPRFFAFYQEDELDRLLAAAGFDVRERWIGADSLGRPEPWISRLAVV
jgi:SAM-dependent methyltransferase